MIRQVLYSWGKLYFPWGIEETYLVFAHELVGLSIADPLSGRWECIEVVPGNNEGFDSAVFRYVPRLPTEYTIDPRSGYEALCAAARGALGPETQPVNSATLGDYEFLLVSWVSEKIDSSIRRLGDCLCKRNGSGKEVCAQIDILQKLKKELGL